MKKKKTNTKYCGKCKRNRNIEKFGRQIDRKGGLSCWCKDCFNKYHRVHRLAWKVAEQTKRYRKASSQKAKAHNLVNNSIAKGLITREACFLCGDIKTDGHHLLYEFPLKVVWLCRPHHKEVHLESKLKISKKN